MSNAVHPALGEAAQICIAAKGQEFSRFNVSLLKDLLAYTKARQADKCWMICDELMNSAEFRAWAPKNGIAVRNPPHYEARD